MSSTRASKNFRQLFSTTRSAERTIIFFPLLSPQRSGCHGSFVLDFGRPLTVVPSWSLLFKQTIPPSCGDYSVVFTASKYGILPRETMKNIVPMSMRLIQTTARTVLPELHGGGSALSAVERGAAPLPTPYQTQRCVPGGPPKVGKYVAYLYDRYRDAKKFPPQPDHFSQRAGVFSGNISMPGIMKSLVITTFRARECFATNRRSVENCYPKTIYIMRDPRDPF